MFDDNRATPVEIVRRIIDILPPTSRPVFASSFTLASKALRDNLDRIRVPVMGRRRGFSVFLEVFDKIHGIGRRAFKSWRDEASEKLRRIYLCPSGNKHISEEYRDELAQYERLAAVALYLTGDAASVYDNVSRKPGSASHTCVYSLLSDRCLS